MSNNVKKPSAVKEFFRKQIVTLKRNPQNIPMAMLLISFVYYSLNLTNMSNTTAKIQGVGMGLCQFCIMLFSLLSIVCMLNAFPKRKEGTDRNSPAKMGSGHRTVLRFLADQEHEDPLGNLQHRHEKNLAESSACEKTCRMSGICDPA